MKRFGILTLMVISGLLMFIVSPAVAEDADGQFVARLTGFQEVPPKLTDGTGKFTATLDSDGTIISYTLSFSNLSSSAVAAHLHFAQRGVNGAIFAFLCGGAGKPACPASGGTVEGTISAADILGIPAQGLAAGDFAGALRVIRSGDTYANVHTTSFPAGEIRGQVKFRQEED